MIPPDDVRRFFAEYFGMEPDAIPMGMRTMLEEIMDAVAEMNRGIRGYLPAGPEVRGLLEWSGEVEQDTNVEPEGEGAERVQAPIELARATAAGMGVADASHLTEMMRTPAQPRVTTQAAEQEQVAPEPTSDPATGPTAEAAQPTKSEWEERDDLDADLEEPFDPNETEGAWRPRESGKPGMENANGEVAYDWKEENGLLVAEEDGETISGERENFQDEADEALGNITEALPSVEGNVVYLQAGTLEPGKAPTKLVVFGESAQAIAGALDAANVTYRDNFDSIDEKMEEGKETRDGDPYDESHYKVTISGKKSVQAAIQALVGDNGDYGVLVLQDESGSLRFMLNPKTVDMEGVPTLEKAMAENERLKQEIEEENRKTVAAWEARTGMKYDPEWRERAKAQEAQAEPSAQPAAEPVTQPELSSVEQPSAGPKFKRVREPVGEHGAYMEGIKENGHWVGEVKHFPAANDKLPAMIEHYDGLGRLERIQTMYSTDRSKVYTETFYYADGTSLQAMFAPNGDRVRSVSIDVNGRETILYSRQLERFRQNLEEAKGSKHFPKEAIDWELLTSDNEGLRIAEDVLFYVKDLDRQDAEPNLDKKQRESERRRSQAKLREYRKKALAKQEELQKRRGQAGNVAFSVKYHPDRPTYIPDSYITAKEVKRRLGLGKGKVITNYATKEKALFSVNQINKMLSNTATDKSVANGFTVAQHNQAALHIVELYRNAEAFPPRQDRDGDPNVESVRVFVAPIVTIKGGTQADAEVYITVKRAAQQHKSEQTRNRIYSLELLDMELRHIGKGERLANNQAHSRPQPTDTIANPGADVKPGNTALSVGGFGLNANARAEMEKVREQYEGTDKWMKAPNGKPTKLNERQWLQVRTPSFKAWFGDWENDPVNASKVVDENGEPLVVYHQTNSKAYINRETGQEWDRITPEERQAWRDRGDWDEHWEEQDFYTFDNTTRGRRSIEMPAFFFSPEYDEYHEYGNRTVAAFLNLRNPATNPEIPNAGVTDTAGEDAMNALMKQGYDGFIRDDDGVVYEINAFRPEQIKSATDNVGTFNPANPDIRLSVGSRMGKWESEPGFAAVRPAEVGRQRRAGAYYPDIGGWLANTAFSIGERRKAEYRAVIGKKRPDLPSADVDAFMGELDKLGNTKAEKAALHWFVKGGLQLPEDGEKLGTALKTAAKFKLDPFGFGSPDELLAEADRRNPKKQKLAYIDPDTVPELTNKRDLGHGVVVYDVEDSPRGQAAMRRIMNSHLGRNADGEYWSPWCLLTPTVSGGVSESAVHYWGVYAATGRNAAFLDGKLIAFQSSDTDEIQWWDMEDRSHGENIPIPKTKVSALSQGWPKDTPPDAMVEVEGEMLPDGTFDSRVAFEATRGDRENGVYERWELANGRAYIKLRETYRNGNLHGKSFSFYQNGKPSSMVEYKNGKIDGLRELYYQDGKIHRRATYSNGRYSSDVIDYYQDGSISSITPIKDGVGNGVFKSFYPDGSLQERVEVKNGRANGLKETWWENGNLKTRETINERGKRTGERLTFHKNGQLEEQTAYKDGVPVGESLLYYESGKLRQRRFFDERGLVDRLKESFLEDGTRIERIEYKNGRFNGLFERWDEQGRPTEKKLYENNVLVKDLLDAAPGNVALSAAMRATGSINGRFTDGADVFRTLDAIERTELPTIFPDPVRKAFEDWRREQNGATRKRLATEVLKTIPEKERFYVDSETGRQIPLSNSAVDSVLFGHTSTPQAVAGKMSFLFAIKTFSERATQIYSEGRDDVRYITYVAPVSYGTTMAYGTATLVGAGADLTLHDVNYFDPSEKGGPVRTTTLQRKLADRRSYSNGPTTKRILKLIHDNQALSVDELNERIHELGANTALSVGERPGRAPTVEPGGDVREAGEGTLAWLRRKFVHAQTPVFDAVRRVMGVGREPPDALNVEAAAKNVHGKIRARQELLQRAYLEPLKTILAQPGMDRKRFDDYALALHALERNRMIQERSVVVDPTTGEVVDLGVEAGSGVTNAWAERVIREVQRDPFAEQYKEAANILAEMNRFVLRGAVADGLLTEAQARTWMRLSPHYVPLKNGGAAPGAIHKRATGRFTRPDSVLVNSMRQAYATVRNGELNRVNKTMADWIRQYDPNGEQVGGTVPESHKHAKIKMTDPQYVPKGSTAEALLRERGIRLVETEDKGGYWVDTEVLPNALKRVVRESVPQGDDIVTFWENGERKFIRFEGKRGRDGRAENEAARIADVLNFKNVLHKEGKFWDAIRGLTRWKANVSTSWNPTFIVRNMGADVFNTANLMMIEGKYAELARTMRNYPAALNRVERSSHALVSFTDGAFLLAEVA